MLHLPPPQRRPGLLQGLGMLLSALVGAAVLIGMFTVGALLAAVLAGAVLLSAAGVALAMKLGWKPAVLRRAEAWRQAAERDQPLDGEYTVVRRGDDQSPR